MRRTLFILASLAGLVVLAMGGLAAASSSSHSSGTTVHVIEHAVTDTVIDTGAPGDSTGDLLTFHNRVYDATNTSMAGRDQGECVRIAPKAGSWECRWTTWVGGGQITVEGPFFDTRNSVLAITGGTGRFHDAHGQMVLVSRAGGTEYDFIFHLS
jgi:Allene oxide cyclase